MEYPAPTNSQMIVDFSHFFWNTPKFKQVLCSLRREGHGRTTIVNGPCLTARLDKLAGKAEEEEAKIRGLTELGLKKRKGSFLLCDFYQILIFIHIYIYTYSYFFLICEKASSFL